MISQNDQTMRVFDTEKKSLLAFDGHTQQINWIESLSPNTFITGADDGQVYHWIFNFQQLKSANMLPCSQTIIPLSINEMLIASSIGVKVCNTNRDDILQGSDVDVVLFGFHSFLIENGQCMQYRIQKREDGQYDIQQKDLIIDCITQLSSKLKPRVQLIKNQDKVMMVIVDQNKINFFDITIK